MRRSLCPGARVGTCPGATSLGTGTEPRRPCRLALSAGGLTAQPTRGTAHSTAGGRTELSSSGHSGPQASQRRAARSLRPRDALRPETAQETDRRVLDSV